MNSKQALVGLTLALLPSAFALAQETTFTKITSGPVVNDSAHSIGCAWGDYDNDGWLDLFVANFSANQNNLLYHNNGDGSFTKTMENAIAREGGNSQGCSWGDYDNDGDLDLFVTNVLLNERVNFLYQNRGGGNFIRIGNEGLGNDMTNSRGCSWVDYDNDGALDLFVANFDESNSLYQNNGLKAFVKITTGSIVNNRMNSLGCSWSDYDNDDDLDLFVTNYDQENALYENKDDGTFERILNSAIVSDRARFSGCAWGDYDNDGDFDLFVTSLDQKNFLYQNKGNSVFEKITDGDIATDRGESSACAWGDYDNDGDLDLFVANESGNNFLYCNNGDRSFTKITTGEIVTDVGYSKSCAWADYDNDGDLDLFVANSGYRQPGENDFLYQNNGNLNHWINFRLIGVLSNASAIGAKIFVKARIRGISFWQVREVSAQTGFLSQSSLNVVFGLADAVVVDSMRIQWPSGIVQDTASMEINRSYSIREKTFFPINSDPFVNDSTYSSGCAWVDYDNDSDLDIFVTTSNNNLLYQNNGEAGFIRITNDPIVYDGSSRCSAWGDCDNDGDLDLFISDNGRSNRLYKNNGKGAFDAITDDSIVNDGGNSQGCTWGDYDNDGDIDLFVANFEQNNFLYNNNGDGTFSKLDSGEIVNEGGSSQSGAWGDYDNDGDIDLFVANVTGSNFLYQNNGDATFAKIKYGPIVDDGAYSRGGAWGDYDNDGDLDLFVTNDFGKNNFLYQNNGHGDFNKITNGSIVNDGGYSRGCAWGDYDNDGDLDLFVTNIDQSNFLYQNDGKGAFNKISGAVIAPINHGGLATGCAWGDYDKNGMLDLFVTYGIDLVPLPIRRNSLYQNAGYKHSWISFFLIGTVSNKSALGARISVKSKINGSNLPAVWQIQEISSQTGYFSHNSLIAEFGLRRAVNIDSIQIRWPYRNGSVNVYANMDVNQFLTIRENNRPRLTHSIEFISLSQVGKDSVLDLNATQPLFEDLDHDTLTYSVASSIPQIAITSISGSLLTVSLVDDKLPGRCQIKISADDGRVDDGRGNTEETSFEINRPPLLFRAIANQTLAAGDTSHRFVANLREVFLDPDGDVLRYSLTNSNPTVALVDTSGTVIFATPGDSTGEATITVFADDRRGGTLSTSFKITNAGQNTPPRVARNIPDQVLIIAGQPFARPLYEVFADANGDSLNFEARSSDRSVALAVVENDTLTIVPLALGSAQITVMANDGKGGEVSTTFQVQVARSKAPFIAHNPVSDTLIEKTPLGVSATIFDDEGKLDEAILRYRVAGRADYEEKRMRITSVDDTTLQVTETIPSAAVLSQGLEYFITASDNRSVEARLPEGRGVFSVRVRVEREGISNLRPQPAGGEQTSYHLFSVPFDLDNKSAGAVFTDDLGAPDIRQWRFHELVMDATTGVISYPEFPNTAPLAPGKAFWLIIRKSGKYIDTGPGTSVLTSQPFAIALQKGWNLVGNPFNFPAYAAEALSNGDPLRYFAYEAGAWSDTLTAISRPWQPFEGYAVYANAACSLYVDPDPSRSTALAKPGSITDSDALWSIRIRGQCQQAKDCNTIAVIHKRALPTWDHLDHPEPPVIGEYVSVYFPHREWNTLAKTYCLDARPEPTEGEVWEFEVKTNIRDKVQLTFAGLESVPPEFEIYLTDDVLRITQNLRESNSYTVAGSENPKSLKLVVGKKDFIDGKFAGMQVIPTHYELSQNFPNPFNPVTTIRYGLPQAGRVSLKIYNLLGEEVATLVDDEQRGAGYHVAIWDGRDKNGVYAASGVYVYRMRAGNSIIMSKKLALIK